MGNVSSGTVRMKRKEKIRIKGSDVILASWLIHANLYLEKLVTFILLRVYWS